jgi:hypothetical protein
MWRSLWRIEIPLGRHACRPGSRALGSHYSMMSVCGRPLHGFYGLVADRCGLHSASPDVINAQQTHQPLCFFPSFANTPPEDTPASVCELALSIAPHVCHFRLFRGPVLSGYLSQRIIRGMFHGSSQQRHAAWHSRDMFVTPTLTLHGR